MWLAAQNVDLSIILQVLRQDKDLICHLSAEYQLGQPCREIFEQSETPQLKLGSIERVTHSA